MNLADATGGVPAPENDAPAGEPISLILKHIRDAIATGRLMPNERLLEVDLAKQLNTNRANIRTALAVLESEGLVRREANRGARVRLLSEQEALEIAETRLALESLIARKAAQLATDDDVALLRQLHEAMRARLEAGDFIGVSALNGDFHRAILRIAKNETIGRLLANLRHQLIRVQFRTILVPGRAAKSVGEHSRIVDAIAAKDPDAAELAMRTHLTGVTEGLKESFAMNRAAPFDS
jgi:DNA-binding GntR family transcriptional regulator